MVETVSSLPLIIKKNDLKTVPAHQYTVEPLYSGHLGDRRKWPLCRGGCCGEVETRVNVWTVRQTKIAVLDTWALLEDRL